MMNTYTETQQVGALLRAQLEEDRYNSTVLNKVTDEQLGFIFRTMENICESHIPMLKGVLTEWSKLDFNRANIQDAIDEYNSRNSYIRENHDTTIRRKGEQAFGYTTSKLK